MSLIIEKDGRYYSLNSTTLCEGDEGFLIATIEGHSSAMYPGYPDSFLTEDECIRYINQNKVKFVTTLIDDFKYLEHCPSIERLKAFISFSAPNHLSYDPIYHMPNLKMLEPQTVYGYTSDYHTEFDCSKLLTKDTLEWFGADCRKDLKNLPDLSNVRSLHLTGILDPDLTQIIGSQQLDSMYLGVSRHLTSLNGISNTRGLTVLKLDSCYKLENIDALYETRDTLQGLWIERCRRIRDFSVLSELKHLKRLVLLDPEYSTIPSISFISSLHELRSVCITPKVQDGHLEYLDGIEDVRIIDHRGYNRKDKDFNKIPFENIVRGDENIDNWRQNVMR